MPPTWTDVLRWAPGTRLGIVLTLKPALREAVGTLLARVGWDIDTVETATLVVARNDAERAELQVELGMGAIALRVERAGDAHVLHLSADTMAGTRTAAIDGIAFQLAGRRDAYVARRVGGAPTPWLRLRYDEAGTALSVYRGALLDVVPAKWVAWLPAELAFARLQRLGGTEAAGAR